MNPAKEAAGSLGSYAYSGKQGGATVPAERSIADIVKDTLSNVQDIIRSEVQLAKVELTQEARKASVAGIMFGAAAVTGFLGFAFCCLCVVYALALVMPAWAAALIVGVGLFVIAAIAFSIGRERWKKVKMPEKTIFTVKEDVAWTHSPNKS
jgi:uncharacterized membrane protein YqjE